MQEDQVQINYQQVRAMFVLHGTSFSRWCIENNVSRAWAIAAINGDSKGAAASTLRTKILSAARGADE